MIAAMLRQPSAQNDQQAHTKNSKQKKRVSELSKRARKETETIYHASHGWMFWMKRNKASKEGDRHHPQCLSRMDVLDEEKRILIPWPHRPPASPSTGRAARAGRMGQAPKEPGWLAAARMCHTWMVQCEGVG
jgi:hypothetical protein